MSLLTICQQAADALALPRPATIIGNANQTARTLLELAQQEGTELARRHAWRKITKEKTFTTTAAEVQAGALPPDFDRIIPDTVWNRSTDRQALGPLTAQQWQAEVSGPVHIGIYDLFRLRGSDFLIYPVPAAGETIVYEYISTQWCESSGGTDQSAWAADSDVGILDERLMRLGLIWRFLSAKGMDARAALATYEREVGQEIARELGFGAVKLDRPVNFGYDFLTGNNQGVVW